MVKDIKTMKQSERFDYSCLNVEKLHYHTLLADWLRKNPHAATIIDVEPVYPDRCPPGHPRTLIYRPENWRQNVYPIFVIPDPENYAYCKVQYRKTNKYAPEAYFTGEDQQAKAEHNQYYVVPRLSYKDLWTPLPWSDLRMQLWEIDCYLNDGSTYYSADGKDWRNLSLRPGHVYEPVTDPHWTESYKAELWAKYYKDKAESDEMWEATVREWAIPERNGAVRHIRRWFPEYQPNLALIENPRNSPVYNLIEPHRWFYRYRSLEDMESDPIWRRRVLGEYDDNR